MSDGVKALLAILCVASCLIGIGYVCGYVHVITTAQAWVTDIEDLVAMTIDGRVYHYYVMQL